MTELPLNSRFKLLDRPFVNPGKCAVCGAVDRPVIDFGLNIDFYGAVLLCVSCIREVSSDLGMVELSEMQRQEAEATRSFEEELTRRNMVGITHEQHGYLADLYERFGAILNDSVCAPSDEDVEVSADFFADESTNSGRTSEQSDNAIVDEGPASVSKRSSNGGFSL